MQPRTEVENNSAREADDGCSAARDAGEQFSSGSGVLEMITLLREMLKRKTPLQGMLKMSSKYSDAETSADGAQSSYSVRALYKIDRQPDSSLHNTKVLEVWSKIRPQVYR